MASIVIYRNSQVELVLDNGVPYNTWTEVDVADSGLTTPVPANATGALILATNVSSAAVSPCGMRKGSDPVDPEYQWVQNLGQYGRADAWIGLSGTGGERNVHLYKSVQTEYYLAGYCIGEDAEFLDRYEGSHTGSYHATIMTDSNANGGSGWENDELIGRIIKNTSTSQEAVIIDNDDYSVTVSSITSGFSTGNNYHITFQDVTPTTGSSWNEEFTISTKPGDTPIAAMWEARYVTTPRATIGIRECDDTYNTFTGLLYDHAWGIVKCDGSNKIETYANNISSLEVRITGYFKSGTNLSFVQPVDVDPTDSYTSLAINHSPGNLVQARFWTFVAPAYNAAYEWRAYEYGASSGPRCSDKRSDYATAFATTDLSNHWVSTLSYHDSVDVWYMGNIAWPTLLPEVVSSAVTLPAPTLHQRIRPGVTNAGVTQDVPTVFEGGEPEPKQIDPPTISQGITQDTPSLHSRIKPSDIAAPAAQDAPAVSFLLRPSVLSQGVTQDAPDINLRIRPATLSQGTAQDAPALHFTIRASAVQSAATLPLPMVGDVEPAVIISTGELLEPTVTHGTGTWVDEHGTWVDDRGSWVDRGVNNLTPATIFQAVSQPVPNVVPEVIPQVVFAAVLQHSPQLNLRIRPAVLSSAVEQDAPAVSFLLRPAVLSSVGEPLAPTQLSFRIRPEVASSPSTQPQPSFHFYLEPGTISAVASVPEPRTYPPNSAYCWGEQFSTEVPEQWSAWSDGAGGSPTISGGGWGTLDLGTGEIAHAPVQYMGEAGSYYVTVTQNKYGSGSGSMTPYIRGQSTLFTQDAGSPSWEEWTTTVEKSWTFIQLRLVGD